MIKGFATPKEGDKDTWPPEGNYFIQTVEKLLK